MCSKKEILIVILIVIVLFSLDANAFGISPKYLENKTLALNRGMGTDYEIILQNAEDKDVIATVTINSTIAKLKGHENVTVPKGDQARIYLEIDPPPNAGIGQVFNVTYSVLPQVPATEGTVSFLMRFTQTFQVKIVEKGGVGERPTAARPIRFFSDKVMKWAKAKYTVIAAYAEWIITKIKDFAFPALITLIAIIVFIALWRKSRFLAERIGRATGGILERPTKGKNRHHKAEYRNSNKESGEPINAKKALKLKNKKKKIRNIKELYDAVYVMDEKTFNHHVNKYRNDICHWIDEELDDDRLARTLSKSLTKDWFIKVLSGEVAHIDAKKRKKR